MPLAALAFAPWLLPPVVDGALPAGLARALVIVAAAAAALWSLAVAVRRRRAPDGIALAGLAALTLLASIAAIAAAGAAAARIAALPYLELALITLALRAAAPPARHVSAALAAAAVALALSVVADGLGLWRVTPPHFAAAARPGGLAGERNFAGQYLALALPLCLAVCAAGWRRLALVAVGWALAWTRCRTAWLAAAVELALFVALTRPRRAASVAALVVVVAALVGVALPDRLQWRQDAAATAAHLVDLESGSGRVRVEQYAATARVVALHPLRGAGLGGWRAAVRAIAPAVARDRVPHGELMRVASDLGLPGAAALLVFATGLFALAWRARRAADVAWLAGLAVVALADVPLYRPESTALVATLAAALLLSDFHRSSSS